MLKIEGKLLDDFPKGYKNKDKVRKVLMEFKSLIVKPLAKLQPEQKKDLSVTKTWIRLFNSKDSLYNGQINQRISKKEGIGREILGNGDFLYGLYRDDRLVRGCAILFSKEKIIFVKEKNSYFVKDDFEKVQGNGLLIFKNLRHLNWAYYGPIDKLLPNGFGVLYECDILKRDEMMRGKGYKFIGRFEHGIKRGYVTLKYLDSKKVKIVKFKENSVEEELDFSNGDKSCDEVESKKLALPIRFQIKIEEQDYLLTEDLDISEEISKRREYEAQVEKFDKINLFCQQTFDLEDTSSQSMAIESDVYLDKKDTDEEMLDNHTDEEEGSNQEEGKRLYYFREIMQHCYKNARLDIDLESNTSTLTTSDNKRIQGRLFIDDDQVTNFKGNSASFNRCSDLYSGVNVSFDLCEVDDFCQDFLDYWGIEIGLCKYYLLMMEFYGKKRIFFYFFDIKEGKRIVLEDDEYKLDARVNQNIGLDGLFFDKNSQNKMKGLFTIESDTGSIKPIKATISSEAFLYHISVDTKILENGKTRIRVKEVKAYFSLGHSINLKLKEEEEEGENLTGEIYDFNNDETFNGVVFQANEVNKSHTDEFLVYVDQSGIFSFDSIKLIFVKKVMNLRGRRCFKGEILNMLPSDRSINGTFFCKFPIRAENCYIKYWTKGIGYTVKMEEGAEKVKEVNFELENFEAKFYKIGKNLKNRKKFELGISDLLFNVTFKNKIKVLWDKKLVGEEEDGNIFSYKILSDEFEKYIRNYFVGHDYHNQIPLSVKLKLDFSIKSDIKLLMSEHPHTPNNKSKLKGLILLMNGGLITTNFDKKFGILEKCSSQKMFNLQTYDNILSIEGRMVGSHIQKTAKIVYNNLSSYEGYVLFERRHLKGVIMFVNQESYNGDWFDGLKHGYGEYKWPNGDFYQGNFRFDMMHGKGVMALASGMVCEGEFRLGNFYNGTICNQSGDKACKYEAGKMVGLIE